MKLGSNDLFNFLFLCGAIVLGLLTVVGKPPVCGTYVVLETDVKSYLIPHLVEPKAFHDYCPPTSNRGVVMKVAQDWGNANPKNKLCSTTLVFENEWPFKKTYTGFLITYTD